MTHLENVSEEEMNRLLGVVLDVEYLYTCVHKEEDADTKQVYFSLFKVTYRLPRPYCEDIHLHCTEANNTLFRFPTAVEKIYPTDG